MKYIQLGKTDLKISRICFGCWQLSPRFWGNIPLKEWQRAVDAALDLGVNFIDTLNTIDGKLQKNEELTDEEKKWIENYKEKK